MKQSQKLILVLLWLMVLASCRHYQYPLVLQEADSLCSVLPDSAVTLLRDIADDMKQEAEHVQTRYKLLTIKANDKAYITHTSDSIILPIIDYTNIMATRPNFLKRITMLAGHTTPSMIIHEA